MTILRTMWNLLSVNIAAGILLFVAVIAVAIIVDPSVVPVYQEFFLHELHLQTGNFNPFLCGGENLRMTEFISDGLMAIFFLLVRLEIGRELLVGEFSSFCKAAFPFTITCGDMLLPVTVYMSICPPGNTGSQELVIPMAMDIAFPLGVLSLLGGRVPSSLKIFLTASAVVDDTGGILIIVLFYSSYVSYGYILIATLLYVLPYFIGKHGTTDRIFFLVTGVATQYLFLQFGTHSTISGVTLAFVVPAKPRLYVGKHIERIRHTTAGSPVAELGSIVLTNGQIAKPKEVESVSDRVISPPWSLKGNLRGAVNYLTLPLFAFASAGVVFSGGGELAGSVGMAVAVGLLFGKFAGIHFFTWLAIKMKLTPMPLGMTWRNLFGVAPLGGIGSTVSFFIANLSSGANYPVLLNQAKFGVLPEITLFELLGYIVLRIVLPARKRKW